MEHWPSSRWNSGPQPLKYAAGRFRVGDRVFGCLEGAAASGLAAGGLAEFVAAREAGLGADAVVDYRAEDFTSARESYDVIVDVAASRSVRDLRNALRPGGVIVAVGFSNVRRLVGTGLAALNRRSSKRVALLAADNWNDDHVRVLADMVQNGQIAPVIDRELDWAQVEEAFAYLAEGHAGGKIIVRIGP